MLMFLWSVESLVGQLLVALVLHSSKMVQGLWIQLYFKALNSTKTT